MGFSLSKLGDKLKEALIKVRMKIAFAPLPLGGLEEGRSYGKEKSKLLVCAGFQPARDLFFWLSTRSCAPPLIPEGGDLLNQSLLNFNGCP